MRNNKTLILGLGNVILGDEGVGVHVAQALEKMCLPPAVEVLDGGTGGFILLEPLESADRVILVDATSDGNTVGTITRLQPRFSSDYPPTLTAHDIGIKDLLDSYYIRGGRADVTLYAISIDPIQPISMELSAPLQTAADETARRILAEIALSQPTDEPAASCAA